MTVHSAALPLPKPMGALLIAVLWLAVCAAMLLVEREAIAGLKFNDPDDALRFVQVRDLLAGQSWYDLTQYRINPAQGGGQLHWSRFIDVQIAALIIGLNMFLPLAEAERWALAVYPILLILPLFIIFLRILGHLGDRAFVIMGMGMVATTFSYLHYFVPLRIDHHNWQLLLSMALLWMALGRGSMARGLVAALLVTLHVEISLEGLPYGLIFGGLFAYDWLRDPANGERLRGFALGVTVAPTIWVLLMRGSEAVTAVHCDAFSRPYLIGAAVTGALLAGLMSLPTMGRTRSFRLAALVVSALVGAGAFVLAGPACLEGPFGNLSPLVRQYWYLGISEGRPIWEQTFGTAMIFGLLSLIGLAGIVWTARREAGGPRADDWHRMILIALASLLLSALVLRTTAVTHAYMVPGYVIAALQILRWGRSLPSTAARVPATAAFILAFPISVTGLAVAAAGFFAPVSKGERLTDCLTPAATARLASLPPTTLFATLDISSDLLAKTPHKVVATGHHRNHRVMHQVLAAFMGQIGAAEKLVRDSGATHLVVCRKIPEFQNFVRYGRDNLAARIDRDQPPTWLAPLPEFSEGSLRAYRIVAAAPVTPE